MKKIFLLIALASVLGEAAAAGETGTPDGTGLAPAVRKVIRVGFEAGGTASRRNGSFTNDPGFTLGYQSGIPLRQTESGQFILGIDISYNYLIGYRLNVVHDYASWDFASVRHFTDERHRMSFIALGVLPEYQHSLGAHTALGVFAGGSIGMGTEELQTHEVSHIVTDSTQLFVIDNAGPYGEYNMSPQRAFYGLAAGANFYYKRVMVGLRYQYTYTSYKYSVLKSYNDLFVQFGFVL